MYQTTLDANKLNALRSMGVAPKYNGSAISKSVETGYANGNLDQLNGAAFRALDLDPKLRILNYTEKNINVASTFLEKVKVNAPSTVHTYMVQTDYGDDGASRFVPEGQVGTVNGSSQHRESVDMKFLSDTRRVTIQAEMVQNLVDPVANELRNGMVTLARTIEYGILNGDADLTSAGKGLGLQFDGLKKLIKPEMTIDKRNKEIELPDLVTQAAVMESDPDGNYTNVTHVFMPTQTHASFMNKYNNQAQVIMGIDPKLGVATKHFTLANADNVEIIASTLMNKDMQLPSRDVVSAVATPTSVTATVVKDANTDPIARFDEKDVERELNYKVRVVTDGTNADLSVYTERNNKSAASSVTAKISGTGDRVDLSIDLPQTYAATPAYVEIFREGTGNRKGKFYLIGRVPFYKATADNNQYHIAFSDTNAKIPGTVDVFMGELTKDAINLFEFAPIMRIDLAKYNATDTFSLMWMGALGILRPYSWARFTNVKESPYA